MYIIIICMQQNDLNIIIFITMLNAGSYSYSSNVKWCRLALYVSIVATFNNNIYLHIYVIYVCAVYAMRWKQWKCWIQLPKTHSPTKYRYYYDYYDFLSDRIMIIITPSIYIFIYIRFCWNGIFGTCEKG